MISQFAAILTQAARQWCTLFGKCLAVCPQVNGKEHKFPDTHTHTHREHMKMFVRKAASDWVNDAWNATQQTDARTASSFSCENTWQTQQCNCIHTTCHKKWVALTHTVLTPCKLTHTAGKAHNTLCHAKFSNLTIVPLLLLLITTEIRQQAWVWNSNVSTFGYVYRWKQSSTVATIWNSLRNRQRDLNVVNITSKQSCFSIQHTSSHSNCD